MKSKLKRFFMRGAEKYLVAGENASESVKKIVGDKEVIPYYFSSLTEEEVRGHAAARGCRSEGATLVIGQYFDYKGMDIALETAKMDPANCYKFVGMGVRTELFEKDFQIPDNVQIIPFLHKEELEEEYKSCSMLVLPSRRECWGLVINEAASFGMPIVSTWGSGAAVEFLAEDYPQFLAKPADPEDLLRCINLCRHWDKPEQYSQFLLNKSQKYHIEKNVQAHLVAIGIIR